MKKIGLLFIVMLLGAVAACNSATGNPPVLEAVTPTTQTDSNDQSVDFSETRIVYRMEGGNLKSPVGFSIDPSGRVVSEDGMEWNIPPTDTKFMFDFVESQEFWNLEDIYGMREDCADCLMVYLKVYHQGDVKELRISSEASTLPTRLEYLLDQLSQLTVSD
jgi:hypothetical protein